MHAFLVMAHTDPVMCDRLVSALAPHAEVHLHINALVDPAPFASSIARASLLTPPEAVRWGSWSLVEAALRLAGKALLNPEVEQVTWLSAQHYPLVHPSVIVGAPPADRIRIHPAPHAEWGKPEWRFRTRFVDAFPPGSRRDVIANGLVRRLPPLKYERILGPHRLYGGTAWWSLTRQTLTEMLEWLDRENEIRHYFERLCVPDESAFHTAVGAVLTERARREGVTDPDPTTMTAGATTYVRWAGGRHPANLDVDSIREAAKDGWWFARKFDSSHPDLIEAAESCWSPAGVSLAS